ncbi:DUF3120 domain-containing protein [Prochlorococcus sp. MIT 1341]|uniref:DUF3120 domain-containing protein n=1 Tax=Prochlorococcus sp. MIT 1341 TaxID=3096221 RepID=UPI002A762E7F|nr:DUF3120 domain-containing protein [Prochlorococcus sp. MIT 1341]
MSNPGTLKFWTSAMVVLPVLIQAPWVRFSPISACLFSFVILGLGVGLIQRDKERWTNAGSLIIGVSGSWLGGCLFWGWFRAYPLWHLPIEAIALPIALWGLTSHWKLGSSFYISCLVGTAFTDISIVLTGVMDKWPAVVNANLSEASLLLSETADQLLLPKPLCSLALIGIVILALSNAMERQAKVSSQNQDTWLVASAALKTTLWIDGLFLLTALIQPGLSGLI